MRSTTTSHLEIGGKRICPTALLATDYMHDRIGETDSRRLLFVARSLRARHTPKSALANLATQLDQV